MKLRKVSTPEKNMRELEILFEKDEFEAAVATAYKKGAGKINIPGFRKGKAPRSIIEKMYGADFFYNDAVNALLPDALDKALEESGLTPIDYPTYDFKTDDEEGFVLIAKFYIYPEFELGQYKGMTADKKVDPVTDEEVDAEIEKIRNRNSRTVEVTDRAAQLEDTVTFDYSGSVDGVKFEGGTAEQQPLKLGSGQFIPGFEDQIVGKKIGEEFDVNVTFPTEYHAEDLAGKDAVFACKLHKIEYQELPELDDEFAKDVSDFDTFDAYKADMKAKIEARHETIASNVTEEQIMDHLIAATEIDVPAPMVDTEVTNEVRSYENRLAQQGISLDMYLKYTGTTMEQLREQARPQAEKQVKLRAILEAIVKAENLEATEEEIEKEYNDIAAAYAMEIDKVKAAIRAEDLGADIKVRKAANLVKDNAVITVIEGDSDNK